LPQSSSKSEFKEIRYCHHSGVVGGGAVLGYNFKSLEAHLMKLYTCSSSQGLQADQGQVFFTKLCPFMDLTAERWPQHGGFLFLLEIGNLSPK